MEILRIFPIEFFYVLLGALASLLGGFWALKYQLSYTQSREEQKYLIEARSIVTAVSVLLTKSYRRPGMTKELEDLNCRQLLKNVAQDPKYAPLLDARCNVADQMKAIQEAIWEAQEDSDTILDSMKQLMEIAIQMKSNGHINIGLRLYNISKNEQLQNINNLFSVVEEIDDIINKKLRKIYLRDQNDSSRKL